MWKSRTHLLAKAGLENQPGSLRELFATYFVYKLILFRFFGLVWDQVVASCSPRKYPRAGALSPCTSKILIIPQTPIIFSTWSNHPTHSRAKKSQEINNSSINWEVSGFLASRNLGCSVPQESSIPQGSSMGLQAGPLAVSWGQGQGDRLSPPIRRSCWFLGSFCSQALFVNIQDSVPHPEQGPAHKLLF